MWHCGIAVADVQSGALASIGCRSLPRAPEREVMMSAFEDARDS